MAPERAFAAQLRLSSIHFKSLCVEDGHSQLAKSGIDLGPLPGAANRSDDETMMP